MKTNLLHASLGAAFALLSTASAGIIGVNYVGSEGDSLAASDVAGAPGAAAANWNNTTVNITGVVEDDGITNHATTSFTIAGPALGNWRTTNSPLATNPNNVMMEGVRFGQETGWTITSANVPYALYDLYVYVPADGNTRDYKITVAGTSYEYDAMQPPTGSAVPFTLATFETGDGAVGTAPDANYAVFSGLSGDFVITMESAAGTGSANPMVAGFQVVQVQLPGLNWDPGDADTGGAGDWDLTTANWESAPGTSPNQLWTPNDGTESAKFELPGGAVNLTADIVADGVSIIDTGYSFTGSNTLTANTINAAQDTSIDAPLAGSGTLTKSGAGTLDLTGTSTGFTGTLDVSEGRVNLDGTLGAGGSGSVTVGDTETLGGEGTISGDLTLGSTGGATLAVDADTGTAISVNNLTLNGVTELELTGTPGGLVVLANFSGTTSPVGPDLTASFANPLGGRFSVTANAGTVTMTAGAPEAITWDNGGVSAGVWSLGDSQADDDNWDSSDGFFFTGDMVTFDDTPFGAPGTESVSLDDQFGDLEPGSVTFANTTGNDYDLSGSPITGSGALVVDGNGVDSGGTVTLNQENTFSGGTTVNRGKLFLNDPSGNDNQGVGVVRGTVTVNGPGILELTQNALGWGNGVNVNTLNVYDGGLVEHVGVADNGWGIIWNLRGSTITTANGTGAGNDVARFSLGNGSSVNTEASADTSEIAGLVTLRQASVTFTVADGGAMTDLLVSAALEEAANGNEGIIKDGAGLMRLSGTNDYDGPTFVDAGCLVLDSVAAESGSGADVLDDAGFGFNPAGFTDGEIKTIVDATVWASASKLVFDVASATTEVVSADLSGFDGAVILVKGGGTLDLSGATVPGGVTYEKLDGSTVIEPSGGPFGAITKITKTGAQVEIEFTAPGNADVYKSLDLDTFIVPALMSDVAPPAPGSSILIDSSATEPAAFYMLVPHGAPAP